MHKITSIHACMHVHVSVAAACMSAVPCTKSRIILCDGTQHVDMHAGCVMRAVISAYLVAMFRAYMRVLESHPYLTKVRHRHRHVDTSDTHKAEARARA